MPPAKKRRIAAEAAAAANQASRRPETTQAEQPAAAPASTVAAGLLDLHRRTSKALLGDINELAGGAADDGLGSAPAASLVLSSSLALTELKSLRRRIAFDVEERAGVAADMRERVQERGLALENLNYERNHLRREIGCVRGWGAEELERMALSELGIVDPSRKGSKECGDHAAEEGREDLENVHMEGVDNFNIKTDEGAINAYLFRGSAEGSSTSYRDPSNHAFILEKLQSDLQTRASLVQQLSKSKLDLKELQKKRDDLRGFLDQIPERLAAVEKAGETLNNFFGESHVWKDALIDEDINDGDKAMGGEAAEKEGENRVLDANLLVHRPSCDRAGRFRLARSNLPSPLYVLFVQIQGYVDACASLETLGGGALNSTGDDGAAAATAARETSAAGEKKSNALGGFAGAKGMDVSAMPPQEGNGADHDWTVVLTLSPSEILPSEASSILGKAHSRSAPPAPVIKIVFSFNRELGVIFASAAKEEQNDKGWDETEGLLESLFPGDDGSVNPNVSLCLLKEDGGGNIDENSVGGEEQDMEVFSDNKVTKKNDGKPYYWCQVLSGLDFPPPLSCVNFHEGKGSEEDGEGEGTGAFQIETCTKAVFRQLLRRVRARKTLMTILEYLGKRSQAHPLPIHPAMRGDDGANQPQIKAKFHSWAEDSKGSNMEKLSLSRTSAAPTKHFIATIKRKSSTLKAFVVIDMQNYPAEPPVWSLQNEDGSSGTLSSWGEEHGSISSLQQQDPKNNSSSNAPPLFDSALHRIEGRINQGLDKFICQNVETTYDWILMHQLAEAISCWDEVMSASEVGGRGGGGARNGDDGAGVIAARGGHGHLRKGRDRRLMGFGERSQFFR